MQNTISINVTGVAGSGKSTISRAIVAHLQSLGFEVELQDTNGSNATDSREKSQYEHIQALGNLLTRDIDVIVRTEFV